jgi:hypothetical protein
MHFEGVGDINADGRADAVAFDRQGCIFTFLGDGFGSWATSVPPSCGRLGFTAAFFAVGMGGRRAPGTVLGPHVSAARLSCGGQRMASSRFTRR